MSTLLQTLKDELSRYFTHLGTRVERAVRALPRDKFWVKPFSFGNSVGHLVLHLTGNLNHYIGAGVAGTGYVRNRPVEFTDPSQYPVEQVLAAFQETVAMVVRAIGALEEDRWLDAVDHKDRHPIETRLGLILVCASHMNNHIGQISYLVQAQGFSTQEPPVW